MVYNSQRRRTQHIITSSCSKGRDAPKNNTLFQYQKLECDKQLDVDSTIVMGSKLT